MTDGGESQRRGELPVRLMAAGVVSLLLLVACGLWADSHRNFTSLAFGNVSGPQVMIMSTSGRLVLTGGMGLRPKAGFTFEREPDEDDGYYPWMKDMIYNEGWHVAELGFPWVIALILSTYAGVLAWLVIRARRIRDFHAREAGRDDP
jgi:hypothetical protein